MQLPARECISSSSDGGVLVDDEVKERHRFHAELFTFDPETLRLVRWYSSDPAASDNTRLSQKLGSTDGTSENWSSCATGNSSSSPFRSSIENRRNSDRESSRSDGCCHCSTSGAGRSSAGGLCTSRGSSTTQRADRACSTASSDDISGVKTSNGNNWYNNSTSSDRDSSNSSNGRSNSGSSSSSSSNGQTPCCCFVDLVVGGPKEVFLGVENRLSGVTENIPLRQVFHVDDDLVLCCAARGRGPLYKQQRDDSCDAVPSSPRSPTSSSLTSVAINEEEAVSLPPAGCAAAAGVAGPVAGGAAPCNTTAKAASPLLPCAADAGGCCPPAPAAAAGTSVASKRPVFDTAAVYGTEETVPFFRKRCLFALRFANVRATEAFVTQASRYFSHSSGPSGGHTNTGQTILSETEANQAVSSGAFPAVPATDWDYAASSAGPPVADCGLAAATVNEDTALDGSAKCLRHDSLRTTRRLKSLKKSQQQHDMQERPHRQESVAWQHQQSNREQKQQQGAQQQRTSRCPTKQSQDQQQQLRGPAGQHTEKEEERISSARSPSAAAAASHTPLHQMDASAVENYFHYYGKLSNQMNILQDTVRTAAYYKAIMNNKIDFEGKVVMDVGAGSGILSFFAAQAGAKRVYAVEASRMATTIDLLCRKNVDIGRRIVILNACVEHLSSADVPEKVDVLVSEPLGTFLFNERMIETYLVARDRFLKPDGKMYPSRCVLAVAPFTDAALYQEFSCKADLWKQQKFFGVDISAAHATAAAESFRQPIVDLLDPALLVAPAHCCTFDWRTLPVDVLKDGYLETGILVVSAAVGKVFMALRALIYLPLQYVLPAPAVVHGLAGWFDVGFDGSAAFSSFSTSPFAPPTHWYQTRFLFAKPLAANEHQRLKGFLRLVGNKQQSYHIFASLRLEDSDICVSATGVDLKDPVYRYFSTSWQSYHHCASATPQQGSNTSGSTATASAFENKSSFSAFGSAAVVPPRATEQQSVFSRVQS